jgi:hypothetical protein
MNLTHLNSYFNIVEAKFFIWLNYNMFTKICTINTRTKDQKSEGGRSIVQQGCNCQVLPIPLECIKHFHSP